MTSSARDYLLRRFRTDADTLRERATALERGDVAPGPDAATSRRMAVACAEVVAMIDQLRPPRTGGTDDTLTPALGDIATLVPLLEFRGASESATPAVRAVYAGAATRIREMLAAELVAQRSRETDDDPRDDMPRADDGEEGDDEEGDDEEVDDDDVNWTHRAGGQR